MSAQGISHNGPDGAAASSTPMNMPSPWPNGTTNYRLDMLTTLIQHCGHSRRDRFGLVCLARYPTARSPEAVTYVSRSPFVAEILDRLFTILRPCRQLITQLSSSKKNPASINQPRSYLVPRCRQTTANFACCWPTSFKGRCLDLSRTSKPVLDYCLGPLCCLLMAQDSYWHSDLLANAR